MPVTTRRSQAQKGVAKKPPSRKPRPANTSREPSGSWDFVSPSESAQEEQQLDMIAHSEDASQKLALQRSSDMVEVLNPLREMAEKVGKQVESFAENLDQFLDSLTEQNRFDAVLEIVEEYRSIAADAVLELDKTYQRERARQLREEWGQTAPISTTSTALALSSAADDAEVAERKLEQVRRLRQWQQEADIWELFRIILELHHNPDRARVEKEKEEAKARLGTVHRFTPEREIFERFLLDDNLARQRSMIKTWLEQTADHQESDVQGIVETLEAKAGRGRGLWSHGWMHTREKIKGEKRLRAWPSAEDSPLPQLRRSDNNEMLVTTLDPDAISRQNRTLEKPDAYFDRAMWIACWEMLRRGKPAHEVSKWCADRKEGWRAVSIGKGSLQSDAFSNAAWRKVCYFASQSDNASDYEAAVYGLLGGSVEAMQKVCRTVDDHLFTYYSAALLRQFDQYLASTFSNRALPSQRGSSEELQDPEQELVSLILKLRTQSTTNTESVQPMKILQSYLLANDLRSMIHTLGHAIAYTDAQRNEGEQMILHLPPFWEGNDNVPEAELGLDPQSLRIATHMSIILRLLEPDNMPGELDPEENVIVAWIQVLRAAGKRDLIPIYASRLQKSRYVVALSRVLPDVLQSREQQEMVTLLQQYHIDVVAVLDAQVEYLLESTMKPLPDGVRPLHMLESTNDTKLYPGQRVLLHALPEDLSEDDEAVIRSLKWYNVLRGHWKDTFNALSLALRKCLVNGRIACALSIVNEFPYEHVSIQKSYQVIGRSVNLMDYDAAPSEEEAAAWKVLSQQSRTYYELEVIVTAIRALATWREREHEFTQAGPRTSNVSPGLKEAKAAVDDVMSVVVSAGLLWRLGDDTTDTTIDETSKSEEQKDEDCDRALIRTMYIPELILAYNTVLHSAGSVISREALIQSMDLSITVARDDTRLSECFVRAGRMRELVTSFAQTSKLMLLLKELGGKRKGGKRDGEGKDLGMWEIGPQGVASGLVVGGEGEATLLR